MISIKIDQNSVDNIVKTFKATEKETSRAMIVALKETTKWAQSLAVKHISKQSGLTQKKVRQKTRVYFQTGGLASKINFYVQALNLINFRARQNKFGVTSKIMSVKSAFIIDRQGARGTYKNVFKRTGRARLPIEPVKVEMRQYAQQAVDTVEPRILGTFWQKFQQKVKWQIGLRK